MTTKKKQTDDVIIRKFKPQEAEDIVAITAEVFGGFSIDAHIERLIGRPAASWVEIKGQVIREELAANPGGCFVAEMGGKIVGYVTTLINKPASRGIIPNLAVTAVCQGKGVGRKLLQVALQYFRDQGLAQAKIETLACNEVGQHLYPSLGFKEVVRQIHYIMPLK